MAKPAPSILIVEDDMDTRDMLARLLTGEGYSVRICANGWEALLAVENPPDLILLDMMLPGMDGASFLKSLRGQKDGRAVPVVVLTALDVSEVTAKVQGLGVLHILPKHGNLFPLLKDTLKRVLPKPE